VPGERRSFKPPGRARLCSECRGGPLYFATADVTTASRVVFDDGSCIVAPVTEYASSFCEFSTTGRRTYRVDGFGAGTGAVDVVSPLDGWVISDPVTVRVRPQVSLRVVSRRRHSFAVGIEALNLPARTSARFQERRG
jgi:hypothetical protein